MKKKEQVKADTPPMRVLDPEGRIGTALSRCGTKVLVEYSLGEAGPSRYAWHDYRRLDRLHLNTEGAEFFTELEDRKEQE